MPIPTRRKMNKKMQLLDSNGKGAFFQIQPLLLRYHLHGEAFKEAADRVLDSLMKDGCRGNTDVLVFPVIFLYRQAIESKLKEMIRKGVDLNRIEEDEKLRDMMAEHELAPLWNKVKKLILHFHPGDDEVPGAEAGILQLHEFDKKGDRFRFSRSLDGETHKYGDLPTHIIIPKLRERADILWSFLDGWDGVMLDILYEPNGSD